MKSADHGTGTLVLIVGPSGAGKDTLMDAARTALREEPVFQFARRVITRPHDFGGEVHESVSEQDFVRDERQGAFALSWTAHGLAYGIRASIKDDIAAGRIVVANVSRGVIAQAERLAPRVIVINITAPVEVLTARLAARGRESREVILQRLRREAEIVTSTAKLVTISNDRAVADAAIELVHALRSAVT